MIGFAIANGRAMGFGDDPSAFFFAGQAQMAFDRQGLGDLPHIFVMHLHAGHGRQRLVQHGGAGTPTGNDEERARLFWPLALSLVAHGRFTAHIAPRSLPGTKISRARQICPIIREFLVVNRFLAIRSLEMVKWNSSRSSLLKPPAITGA